VKIKINYDPEKAEKSQKRFEDFENFKKPDRIPVVLGLDLRYYTTRRGISFTEFFQSPENMVYHQLINYKWRLEHLKEDWLHTPYIEVYPDFQNTTTAGIFSNNIIWPEDKPPRLFPILRNINDIDKLKPIKDSIAEKKIRYALKMQEIIKKYRVELNGKEFPLKLGTGFQEGVVTAAIDLAGENLLYWCVKYPEKVKKLCEIITEGSIKYERKMREIAGLQNRGSGQSTDGAEMFSPAMFEEIFVPYMKYWFQEFGGDRHIHHCGDSEHLWSIYKDKIKFTHFDGFSYNCNRKRLKNLMGNKVHLMGNINPFVFLKSANKIREECIDVLNNFGKLKGFVMMDGYNIPPEADPDKLNIVYDTVTQFEY